MTGEVTGAPVMRDTVAPRRVASYAAVVLVAAVAWGLIRAQQAWSGPADLHVALEAFSVVLAAACASISLIRYYTRPHDPYLLLGAGMVGAALLEGWHLVVSTSLLPDRLAPSVVALSPWSFMVARTFLAALLLSAVLAWEPRGRAAVARVPPVAVYAATAVFTVAAFIAMAGLRLPPAYRPELLVTRPFELVPGALFLAALVIALRRGRWRKAVFHHWLVLGLTAMTVGQLLFMAQSQHLYGPLFFAGHVVKVGGFVAILVGLLSSVTLVFRRSETAAATIARSNAELRERNAALDAFSATLQQLHRITMTHYPSYDALFADYLSTGCARLGVEIGLISEVRDHRYIVRAARGPFGWKPGDEFPLDDMFCAAVVERQEAVTLDAISRDPRWADHPTHTSTGIEAYLGAPIYRNREVYGTLCFSSTDTRSRSFTTYDEDLVTAMAQTVGRLLEREDAERRQAEIDRLKDEFVSVVSHELRTPLTSIRGSLGLLAGGVLGPMPEKGRRMIQIAAESTDRLVELINDILDVEKMQAGKVTLDLRAESAAELVRDAIDALQPLATQAAITLSGSGDDALITVDRHRIQQALTNLIGNAIKFSPPGEEITVSCRVFGDDAVFAVTDRGRGIPADRLHAVFDRFAQVDSSDARDKGGTGLGLAITKEIVEMHGGRIWVESTLGMGSTFTFTIPSGGPAAAVDDRARTVST
jgi:signal transduction histidine kinase